MKRALLEFCLTYLFILAAVAYCSKPAHAQEEHGRPELIEVRLTWYAEAGVTYGGYDWTHAGGAACSWNLPLGTRLRLENGEEFVCNDRGRLGDQGWLDFWRRPDLPRTLGEPRWGASGWGYYATVEVLE